MSIQEPSITIRDLLDNSWDPTNTSINGRTPNKPIISTGWFNNAKGDVPQIAIVNPDEDPLGGGDTTFRAQDGVGNPVRLMLGTVDVVSFAHHEMYNSPDINPKTIVFDFSEEIRRIINSNTFNATDLQWVVWAGRTKRVDIDADPVLFRQDCVVRYFYIEQL